MWVKGVIYIILSCACYVIIGAIEKHLVSILPFCEVAFFRYLSGLVMFVPYWFLTKRQSLKTDYVALHFVRALAGVACLYCFIFALRYLQLSSLLLFKQTLPLFLPLIAFVWLREDLPKNCWRNLAIGMTGVVIILRPGSDLFQIASFIAILGAFFAASGQVCIRKTVKKDSHMSVLFYLNVTSFLLVIPLFIINGGIMPDLNTWLWIALLGMFGITAQVLLIKSYSLASPAQVAPFFYLSVPMAVIFDLLIWNQVPNFWFWTGAVFIAIGGILTIRSKQTQPATSN